MCSRVQCQSCHQHGATHAAVRCWEQLTNHQPQSGHSKQLSPNTPNSPPSRPEDGQECQSTLIFPCRRNHNSGSITKTGFRMSCPSTLVVLSLFSRRDVPLYSAIMTSESRVKCRHRMEYSDWVWKPKRNPMNELFIVLNSILCAGQFLEISYISDVTGVD